MKEKKLKLLPWIILSIMVVIAIVNVYNWIVTGNQRITISTANKAYSNSKLYVSVAAEKNNEDLETKVKIKLLNSKGRKVKGSKVSYDGNNATIEIPEVDEGNYIIKTKVSTNKGKDTIEKPIYISKGAEDNITITMDKGIYKPGDEVNFRGLITRKENDEPFNSDAKVYIFDGNNNKVYNEDVKASEYGIISGKFKLADEVNSGTYKITIKTENTTVSKQFKVNPYITPKYEVKITPDKEGYIVGDTAKFEIEAKYFFREPAADTKYKIYMNDKLITESVAGKDGKASFEYKLDEASVYNLKIEAEDSSNYFVEANTSINVGTDIFEIELYPEYGNLIANKKNNVYVFTKKTDGTPVKTYITVTTDNYTKQIATDENGIGSFSIDIEDFENSSNRNSITGIFENSEMYIGSYSDQYVKTGNKVFDVTAKDMENREVKKSIRVNVENKNLLVSTDKVKYNQQDDIKINLNSSIETTKYVYIFKNDKLLKMASTDSDEITVNLEDTYGIIDIYVTQEQNYYTKTAKRTIFIKPDKALNISIKTDKDEYQPGDKINISFSAEDEKNNSVDAALLVSMLDNSVLNLAGNDISIDNIKLALEDINFSNELDAATLYASIINDKSEQTIMALLLKQKDRDIQVSETVSYNYETKDRAKIISILIIAIIIIYLGIYLSKKINGFGNILLHAINYIIFFLIVGSFASYLIEAILWKFIDFEMSWIAFTGTALISLAIYILFVSKINKKINRTSISIVISVLTILGVMIMQEMLEVNAIAIFVIAMLVFFVAVVILATLKVTRENRIVKILVKETIYIIKFLTAVVISFIVARILEMILYSLLYSEYIGLTFIIVYFFNYLFNIKNKTKENAEKQESDKNENRKSYVIMTLAIIGGIAIIYLILEGMSTFDLWEPVPLYRGGIIEEQIHETADVTFKGSSSSSPTQGILDEIDSNTFDATVNSSSTLSEGTSILGELANSLKNNEKNSQKITNTPDNEVSSNDEKIENNIRNVFLESMCFVPELILQNGNANLGLTLSDNITTWTIQTVGNTKDGRIGYASLDNVKVFKDFFVDLELPKNSIETDKISIPVTVYNYTKNNLSVTLKVKEEDWFSLDNSNNISISVPAEKTEMIYIPITISKHGENKFRVEATANELTDIIEKSIKVSPKGYKVEKVVSSGSLEGNSTDDIIILDDIVENTASATVKIYASPIAETIEGMENIFRMPTGCFEQVSSSLYPNIVALKYMEDNNIIDEETKTKALGYISSGYQKLLTYEVKGEPGGYSLYGSKPAETVLTAYGLMEFTNLKEVYKIDDEITEKMNTFLYSKQNSNGSFTITGNHIGGAQSNEKLALNAYIIWALTESNPKDERLSKSIDYLKSKLDKVDDNYTLALIANSLANVDDKEANSAIKRLIKNIVIDDNSGYITSNITDYYGSRGNVQNIQTTALTSIALSKTNSNTSTNELLINYLVTSKDSWGTWGTTQATVLALKALNEANKNANLSNQEITLKINSEEQKIEIKDNPLSIYQATFKNLGKENKLNINLPKGKAYYEVTEEYYVPYENIDTSKDNISVAVNTNQNLKVNEVLNANIKLENKEKTTIRNGMVTITIPQGFTIIEESLSKMKTTGLIEKYEMNYTSLNIYLRDFEPNQVIDLDVQFRAGYPVEATGLSVRAYDYYNPQIEGKTMPIPIKVTK